MSSGSFKSVCLVVDTPSSHKHLFSAQQSDEAKSVLAVKTPIKSTSIDAYFVQEDDLPSIKESLVEKPTVYRFDQVFRSSV